MLTLIIGLKGNNISSPFGPQELIWLGKLLNKKLIIAMLFSSGFGEIILS